MRTTICPKELSTGKLFGAGLKRGLGLGTANKQTDYELLEPRWSAMHRHQETEQTSPHILLNQFAELND